MYGILTCYPSRPSLNQPHIIKPLSLRSEQSQPILMAPRSAAACIALYILLPRAPPVLPRAFPLLSHALSMLALAPSLRSCCALAATSFTFAALSKADLLPFLEGTAIPNPMSRCVYNTYIVRIGTCPKLDRYYITRQSDHPPLLEINRL